MNDAGSHTSEDVFTEDDAPDIDCYGILGVEKKASEEEIKRAYRRSALRWHPGISTPF